VLTPSLPRLSSVAPPTVESPIQVLALPPSPPLDLSAPHRNTASATEEPYFKDLELNWGKSRAARFKLFSGADTAAPGQRIDALA
jgi:hypothetical protein